MQRPSQRSVKCADNPTHIYGDRLSAKLKQPRGACTRRPIGPVQSRPLINLPHARRLTPNAFALGRKLGDHGFGLLEWKKACMITRDAGTPTPTPYLLIHTAGVRATRRDYLDTHTCSPSASSFLGGRKNGHMLLAK